MRALFVHFDVALQPERGYKGDDQGGDHRQESVGERCGVESVKGIYGAGAGLLSRGQKRPDEGWSGPGPEEEGSREDAHTSPDLFVRERVCGGVVGRGLDRGEADPAEINTGDAPAKVERKSTESVMITIPVTMGSRTPTRSESRPVRGERIARAAAPGVRISPVAPTERPFTSTTSRGTKMSAERLTSMEKNPTITAATYDRFLNSVGETNG